MVVLRNGFTTRVARKASATRQAVRPGSISPANNVKHGSVHDAGINGNTSPLSALSTSGLIRGLFINSISSKSFLLSPAISIMMFLCRPNRPFAIDVNRNKALASVVKQTVYKQFCAGENEKEVRRTLSHFEALGFHGTIITYAKEIVFDAKRKETHTFDSAKKSPDAGACPNIEAWRQGVSETIQMLGKSDQLAIKITGAGSLIIDALGVGAPLPKQMCDALTEIGSHCKRRGVRVLIDAESSVYQNSILEVGLDLMRQFNGDGHAIIYNTYQAYLKSAPSTINAHLEIALKEKFTLGLKLVRGAYLGTEPRSLIWDTKADTDAAYNSIAHGTLRRQFGNMGVEDAKQFPSVNLMLCSHNKESVFSAYELHQQRLRDGLPTSPIGFAQLQGMTDELSLGLLQLGAQRGSKPEVYKCSTWGSVAECLGYLTRRARENRDAAGRTIDEYRALKAEARRRAASWIFPKFWRRERR